MLARLGAHCDIYVFTSGKIVKLFVFMLHLHLNGIVQHFRNSGINLFTLGKKVNFQRISKMFNFFFKAYVLTV